MESFSGGNGFGSTIIEILRRIYLDGSHARLASGILEGMIRKTIIYHFERHNVRVWGA